jgi:hypothetical protein
MSSHKYGPEAYGNKFAVKARNRTDRGDWQIVGYAALKAEAESLARDHRGNGWETGVVPLPKSYWEDAA